MGAGGTWRGLLVFALLGSMAAGVATAQSAANASVAAAAASASAAAASAAASASAPASSAAPSPAARIEVTGTAQAAARNDSVGSKTVVGREEIRRFGDTQASEVLRRLPGVTVEAQPARPAEVRLRGLGAGYVRITINGEAPPPGFSIEGLATSQIERIEIDRSPSADTSGQAIAGTINIVLRTVGAAERSLQLTGGLTAGRPLLGVEGRLAQKEGAWQRYVSSSVQLDRPMIERDTAQELAPAALSVANSAVQIHQLMKAKSLAAALSTGVQVRTDDGLNLGVDGFVRARKISGVTDGHWSHSGPDLPPPLASDRAQFDFQTVSLQIKPKATWTLDSASKLELVGGMTYNRKQLNSHSTGFNFAGIPAEDERATTTTWIHTENLQAVYKQMSGLDFGFELDRSSTTDRLSQEALIAFQTLSGTSTNEAVSQVRRWAVFSQSKWQIGETLDTYLGGRIERIAMTGKVASVANAPFYTTILSPIARAAWKPAGGDDNEYTLALSRTFRMPTAKDLIPHRTHGTVNGPLEPDEVGNPALRPELAWGLDLGHQQKLGRVGTLAISVFGRQLSQAIITDSFIDDTGRWIERKTNGGAATLYGAELDARLDLRKFDVSWPNASVNLYMAINRSRLRDVAGGNTHLDQQAPLNGKVTWEHRLSAAPGHTAWRWGGQLQMAGASDVRRSEFASKSTLSRTSVDLYASWQAQKELSWKLTGTNVGSAPKRTGQHMNLPEGQLREFKTERSPTGLKLTLALAL